MSSVPETRLSPAKWWEGAAEERLLVLRCPVCTAGWLPFTPYCPDCGRGPDPEVVESSGRGTIYSWVGVRSSVSAPEESPFVVASVMLDEGTMIYGRLVGDPAAGAEVAAVFVERDGRTTVDFARVSA